MKQKHILCFGDSLTWGFRPGLATRFDEDERWTGVLRRELGEEYCVHEDGISGRTSVFEDPYVPWRCGKDALGYTLMSQKPLDLVILMIGTNDLKFTDGYGAARGADCLVKLILDANHVYKTSSPVFERAPKVLLIAPPVILPEIDDGPLGRMIHDGHRQSLLFAPEYARVAQAHRIDFLDAAQYAVAGPADCVHIGAASHLALGEAAAAKVREMFAE